MTPEDLDALRRDASDQLKAKLAEVVKAESAALEKLTLDQLVEAVIQACECGDFMRHVVCGPNPGQSADMRDVVRMEISPNQVRLIDRIDSQAITYVPYRREHELKARIKALETAADRASDAMRVASCLFNLSDDHLLMQRCRELERVVEDEA